MAAHGGGLEELSDLRWSDSEFRLTVCASCREVAVWRAKNLVYPSSIPVSRPNDDLPEDIKGDYSEAAAILVSSPRGAAALLRLCIEKLCASLGDPKKGLNENIGALVAEMSLGQKVQRALDMVRVIGNHAVHPGTLDIKDDTETASTLFELINMIANEMLTQPRKIKEAYSRLPTNIRKNIDRRDGK